MIELTEEILLSVLKSLFGGIGSLNLFKIIIGLLLFVLCFLPIVVFAFFVLPPYKKYKPRFWSYVIAVSVCSFCYTNNAGCMLTNIGISLGAFLNVYLAQKYSVLGKFNRLKIIFLPAEVVINKINTAIEKEKEEIKKERQIKYEIKRKQEIAKQEEERRRIEKKRKFEKKLELKKQKSEEDERKRNIDKIISRLDQF